MMVVFGVMILMEKMTPSFFDQQSKRLMAIGGWMILRREN
jgi:hypothetical protein